MHTVGSLAGGRYSLGELLGRGGMAQVRQATDTVLGREVAIKLFREDLDEDAAGRVEQEMQTLAGFTHPGLVSVHDAGVERDELGADHPFLVMELVKGPTLAEACREGAMPSERVRALGAELASALAYVHSRGVVHRDVKPANILLSPSGVKLADFGIARIVDGARHTSTGLTVGTAPYLAPEQVSGEPIGPAVDVYSLGLVLLECLTGHREYDGSQIETALARLSRPPHVPAELAAPWPELLTAMTRRLAEARPSAQEVAVALGADAPTVALTDPTRAFPVQRPQPAVLADATRALPLRRREPAVLADATRALPLRRREPAAAWWTRRYVAVAGGLALAGLALLLAFGALGGGAPVRTAPRPTPVTNVTTAPTIAPAARVAPTPAPVAPAPHHVKGKGHHGH